MSKPIPYGRQHISEEDIAVVIEALKSDYLTQGPRIEQFEKEFAHYVGADYAVAVANGTAALHLSAMVLNVNEHSNVITTPITFAASANCIRYCGGHVHFVDIDPATYTIDLNKLFDLLKKSKEKFVGIIPVDFGGYPVDMQELKSIANEYNLWIVEDACHAPGGYFKDGQGVTQKCGNGIYADMSIFSFHPVKHIASGEGGMITTNNLEYYKRLKLLRTHGITKDPSMLKSNHGGWYYEMQELGYNYRITDFQAALGSSQLKRADWGMARRHEIALKYDHAFEKTGILRQKRDDRFFNAFHLYIIEIENRKELYDHLVGQNIYPQVHYIPVHLQPYYLALGFKLGDFPIAEGYYSRCLSLPMFPTLTDVDQNRVIESVLKFIS